MTIDSKQHRNRPSPSEETAGGNSLPGIDALPAGSGPVESPRALPGGLPAGAAGGPSATDGGADAAIGPPRGAKTSVTTNSIGIKFALIPAGEFMMGAPESDRQAAPHERPQRPVRITRAFYLGVTEITRGQYRSVTGTDPSHFKGSEDLPVESVSWLGAVSFCNALSAKEGLEPFYQADGPKVDVLNWRGSGYRLPTEAEWEYACRARNASLFCFGNDHSGLEDYAWHENNSGRVTHPVGLKFPNAFGLCDMHGNVVEWCWDWYDGYDVRSPIDDPVGPHGASDRVARGSNTPGGPWVYRSSARGSAEPSSRSNWIGFRVARCQSEGGISRIATSAGESSRRATVGSPPAPPAAGESNAVRSKDALGNAATRALASGAKAAQFSTNSIGMKLALIPPGEFMMGSPDADLMAENHEKPQHRVLLAQPFYLGVCEVTQAQYRAVTGDTPASPSFVGFLNGDDLPVYCLSWKDAVEFCNTLSKKESLSPYYVINGRLQTGGEGYRLPTEAEWEYSCRAGNAARYYFGDESTKLVEYAWIASNSEVKPHPVGQKRPNAFGLYDMAGNISEFCGDPFRADSYTNPRPTPALDQSLTAERVVRGGGFSSPPRDCRSATRGSRPPDFRFSGNFANFWGFRVARNFRPGDRRGPRTDVSASPASEFLPVALHNLPPTASARTRPRNMLPIRRLPFPRRRPSQSVHPKVCSGNAD